MHVKHSSMLPGNGQTLVELAELPTVRLAELAQAGEREAFDPLFRRFSSRLLGWAVRRTGGDVALAEDIVSETWTAMVTAIEGWCSDGTDEAFLRFLFGLARVKLHRLTANLWRETGVDLELIDVAASQTPTGDDADLPNKPELLARLRGAIEALPPAVRQVVRMRLDGMNNAEITQATGLTSRQAADTWKRAQAILRRNLIDIDVTAPADDLELMRTAAQQLQSPRVRQVALMRLDGMSNREVTQATGLTANQAADAWHCAKKTIRKHISRPDALRRATDPRHAERQERERAALRTAAQQLAPAARQVALMHLDGMPHCEIAQSLGKPVDAVKSSWRRARTAFVRHGVIAEVGPLPTPTGATALVAVAA